jgi:putative transposase
MSRPLRIEFAGGLYHVTSRGDGREAIFLAEEDRGLFLGVLSEVVPNFNRAVHAGGIGVKSCNNVPIL